MRKLRLLFERLELRLRKRKQISNLKSDLEKLRQARYDVVYTANTKDYQRLTSVAREAAQIYDRIYTGLALLESAKSSRKCVELKDACSATQLLEDYANACNDYFQNLTDLESVLNTRYALVQRYSELIS